MRDLAPHLIVVGNLGQFQHELAQRPRHVRVISRSDRHTGFVTKTTHMMCQYQEHDQAWRMLLFFVSSTHFFRGYSLLAVLLLVLLVLLAVLLLVLLWECL